MRRAAALFAIALLLPSVPSAWADGDEAMDLNLGLAQRERGPGGSLTRVIPLWTCREEKAYGAKDWLIWPLMTGYSRWSDASEFFSVPILAMAHTDFRAGKAADRLGRWWVCAPLLSGGTQWDRGRGPESAHTFLPVLSEYARSPSLRDLRLVGFWDVTLVRAAWRVGRDDGRPEVRQWGFPDPVWRGGRVGKHRHYGWMAPLFDYEADEPHGAGHFGIMPLFLKWEWDALGHTQVKPSGAAFERAWPLYLHDRHTGEHHVLWPLFYSQRSGEGERETLIRPLWGRRRTPEFEETGFGPAIWPLERGFPSDPLVVGHRLIQPLTLRRAPDASAVNVLWPLLFHHGRDLQGTETSALLAFIHSSRRPDPHGGEMTKTRVFPLFSRVKATRRSRTLIFPLLWGWEENDAGRYVRPLLIFKVRTGPPAWAKDPAATPSGEALASPAATPTMAAPERP